MSFDLLVTRKYRKVLTSGGNMIDGKLGLYHHGCKFLFLTYSVSALDLMCIVHVGYHVRIVYLSLYYSFFLMTLSYSLVHSGFATLPTSLRIITRS